MEEERLRPFKKRSPFLRGCLVMLLIPPVFLLLMLGISKIKSLSMFTGERVAVLPITGVITDSERSIEFLKRCGKDDSVKAVVLRINSGGGGVAPSQEIYEEVRKLKEKKPVVCSMGSVAASGGYYIASAAHRIFANPGTMTGSIGVKMPFMSMKDLMEKIGIRGMTIKSGEFKDVGSPLREMSQQEQQVLQAVVDNVHMQFVNAVAAGRNLSPEEVMPVADGRIMTGEQALALGLVDEMGNLEDAVRYAAARGGIKGEPRIISPPRSRRALLSVIREEVSFILSGKTDEGIPLQLN